MSNYKREFKKLIVLFALFIGLFTIQFIYYFNQSQEDIYIGSQYLLPENPWISSSYKSLTIVKPSHPDNEKSPVIILLHGDQSNSRIMNNLKVEYLRNGYIVALIDVGYFDLGVLLYLNATINYLLTRSDVNASQIGIQGHSHGAHYAALISVIRNDTIKAVVCGNYASYDYWFNDFYPYFKYFIAKNDSLPDTYGDYIAQVGPLNLPFNLTSINNLLMISDSMDYAPGPDDPIDIFKNFTENLCSSPNILYGTYSDGSARKLYLTNSIFGHGTSLFLPDVVLEAVTWMNNVFQIYPTRSTLIWTNIDMFFSIGFIVMLAIIGFYAISTFISLIPYQKLIFNDFKERLHRKSSSTELKTDIFSIENQTDYNDLIQMAKPITLRTKMITISALLIGSFLICLGDFLIYIIDYDLISTILFAIKDLPFLILEGLGFKISTIISRHYPFESMFIWVVITMILWKKVLKPAGISPKPIINYSFRDFYINTGIAFEIYGFSFLILKYSVYNILGLFLSESLLADLIFGIFILYYLNLLILVLFKAKPIKSGKDFVLEFIFTFAIYFILVIPSFILSDFSIWFTYNSLKQIISIGSLAFLNPLLKKKGINILSITIFDLLFYGFIFSLF